VANFLGRVDVVHPQRQQILFLYISIVSQIVVPIGICGTLQATGHLHPAGIWTAIVLGHFTRMALSVLRFRQGKWRHIAVDIDSREATTA
jgi:Na+-driven multidrug efflux pump